MPLFEGDDELDHFRYVNYIATHLALPDMNQSEAISHEVVQPPLYYVASSLFIGWTDRSDLEQIYRVNKDRDVFFYDHTEVESIFPPQGTTLAVRINRLVSCVLGIAVILLIYHIALGLFKHEEAALVAAALTAFNPKYVQMSSTVSNDIAAAFAGAVTLFCLVRLLHQPHPLQKRQVIALGACVGLAFLCKTNGLALFMPVAIALAYLTLRNEKGKPYGQFARKIILRIFEYGGLCLAGFLLIAGWYLVYCQIRYGNPLVWSQVQSANSALIRSHPLSVVEMISTIPEIINTYWSVFRTRLNWSPGLDAFFLAFDGIMLIGLCIRLARRQSLLAVAFLSSVLLASAIAFIPWWRDYQNTENTRLLAPAFAALPPMLAVGLLEWFPRRLWRQVSRGISVVAAAGSCAIIGLVLIPTYDTPRYLSLAEQQALPSTGSVLFDNGIEMVHASLSSNRVGPGDEITLTVYWHATTLISRPYQVSIETLGQDGTSLDRRVVEPLNGRMDTARWGTGVLRDEYHLQYKPVDKQTVANIFIGWIRVDPPYQASRLAGSDAESAQIGEIKLRGARQPDVTPTQAFSATFGHVIGLEGYDLDNSHLRLYWRSLGMPDHNYIVFVHALDGQGNIIAQSDQPVEYHTSLWDPGEQVIDDHVVTSLAKATSIQVGIYDPATNVRLHALRPDGVEWTDDLAIIKYGE